LRIEKSKVAGCVIVRPIFSILNFQFHAATISPRKEHLPAAIDRQIVSIHFMGERT
jgi:hypothetical protein